MALLEMLCKILCLAYLFNVTVQSADKSRSRVSRTRRDELDDYRHLRRLFLTAAALCDVHFCQSQEECSDGSPTSRWPSICYVVARSSMMDPWSQENAAVIHRNRFRSSKASLTQHVGIFLILTTLAEASRGFTSHHTIPSIRFLTFRIGNRPRTVLCRTAAPL